MEFAVYVISAGRPEAVGRLAEHLDEVAYHHEVYWLVPECDLHDYEDAGAFEPLADPGSLVGARNAALEHAFRRNLACVQLSDDLKRLRMLPKENLTLGDALWHLDHALDSTGLALAGCSPTDNLYFAKGGVSTRKFIVGDLIMVRPTELRFDENLRLKEDYDFTLQHWMMYGGAARCDYIAPSFAHYTNAGGAVAARTAELEQETIAYLKDKWPGMIRDNPRRANEILLPTPKRHR